MGGEGQARGQVDWLGGAALGGGDGVGRTGGGAGSKEGATSTVREQQST